MEATRNVVLFGECGVGKSSIINAIVGQPVAKTSNDVFGCTDQNTSYTVTLDMGIKVNLWDTIGLDEGTAGRVPADLAKQHLKRFLKTQIEISDGVDLLLYCIRGASGTRRLPVKRGHWDKYKFVFEEVCKKRIPIALIVTHLESYNTGGDMDMWWNDDEGKLSEFGFQFCAHACITIQPIESGATHGDANRIEVSRRKLQDLLSRNFLAPRNVLLLGDREDRVEFIDMTVASCKRDSQGVPPFTCIPVAFDRHTHVNFWDLTGIDETDDDTLVTNKNLKALVHGIKQAAGLDLLLFCFRAGRPKVRHARSYNLFHAAICRKKLPVAIVVLGPEEGGETWWQRNEQDLRQRGFRFDRHLYLPFDPCQLPSGDLDVDARRRLIDLLQEEHTLGSWTMGDDTFWVTVPNVRAVVGNLSWPTTTVVVCDTTEQDAFADIALGVQTRLRRSVNPNRVYRFQHVDPQTLVPISRPSPDKIRSRTGSSDLGSKGIGLVMFFISADKARDDETWKTLERLHSIYKGGITPLVVVIHGVLGEGLLEGFWRAAPRHIRRRIGACLAYHPGPNALPETRAVAEEILVEMIQDRCLADLGERVGILREILSVWRKYRSAR